MYRNSTGEQMNRRGTGEHGYRCCTRVVQDYRAAGVVQGYVCTEVVQGSRGAAFVHG